MEKKLKPIAATETLALRQSVLRPGLPLAESKFGNDELQVAGHFGVFVDERLVAVGSVYPEVCDHPHGDQSTRIPSAWRLRGMATHPDYRSLGCGELVLQACLDHARQMGGAVVWAHARTGALKFYLRHGFETLGPEYDIPTVGLHYLMVARPYAMSKKT